jgi:hypothetical protein
LLTGEKNEIINENPKIQDSSTLYISESNVEMVKHGSQKINERLLSPSYDGSLLILKEKMFKKLRVYHICENTDINTLKGIEAIEQFKGSQIYFNSEDHNKDNIYLAEYETKELHSDSKSKGTIQNEEVKINREEGKTESSNLTLQLVSDISEDENEDRKRLEQVQHQVSDISQPAVNVNPQKNPYYRLSSVLNFVKQAKTLQADKELVGILDEMSDQELLENKAHRERIERKLQEIDRSIQ